MVMLSARQLKVGAIIDKTLGVLEHSAAATLIFVVALAAMNTAVKYLTLEVKAPLHLAGVGLVTFVVGVSAAYLLLDAMVRKTGLRSRTDDDVFLSYFALSIVYTLGVMAGLLLILIGALLVMARWSIAQPMLIARGGGVMKTLGESWERTSGNELQIIGAALALLILPVAVLIACSFLFDPANLVGIVLSQLVTTAMSAVMAAMGVALYGLIESGRVTAGPSA